MKEEPLYREYEACRLCPRACGVNRYEKKGFCQSGTALKVARAALHYWEEPCISGTAGSGAVFFSGCSLKCCFCQNRQISAGGFGTEITVERLGQIFLELEQKGAANINLVTATHFLPQVKKALEDTKKSRHIPVVWNTGGYETVETVRSLEGLVDIWLPDMKYADPRRAALYSAAADYPETALNAIREMIRLSGDPVEDGEGLLKKGVVIRHLIMPGGRKDSVEVLHLLKDNLPEGSFRISLLRQFTPTEGCKNHPEINRRLTGFEYESVVEEALRLGLADGYRQEKSSAGEEYVPPFDLEGV